MIRTLNFWFITLVKSRVSFKSSPDFSVLSTYISLSLSLRFLSMAVLERCDQCRKKISEWNTSLELELLGISNNIPSSNAVTPNLNTSPPLERPGDQLRYFRHRRVPHVQGILSSSMGNL